MGKKISEDLVIVDEAKKRFGHLSAAVNEATWIKELAPALRSLARDLAASDPNTCDKILAFQNEHSLTGISPRRV